MKRVKQRMERRRKQSVSFEDVPEEFRAPLPPDATPELERRCREWFEAAGLSFVDYLSWLRNQDPAAARRPPSRRRFLTQEQTERLDAELEREGFQW